jgi:tetratricopeptide (TPR) repeat protein
MVWDNFESLLETFDNAARGSRPIQDGAGALSAVTPVTALGYTAEERTRIINLFRDWTEDPAGHGRLLITCRPRDASLPGVRRMELAGLARPDSFYLLAQVLRKHDASLDDERFDKDNLEALLDVLRDHRLSIELVGPHLKQLTPERIVADFRELLDHFTGDAEVERNRSLLASLRFSTSRLRAQAQAVLPWLGLFQGGVFEQILLDVSQMDPAAWDQVRAELEATALVRVETDIEINHRSYLRFHPTLPYAVARAVRANGAAGQADADDGGLSLAAQKEVRQRFIEVYRTLTEAVDMALHGSDVRGGMDALALEEANVRTAVLWAVASDQFDVAAWMGGTIRTYLHMSARLREHDQWSAWLAHAATHITFSEAVAGVERERAWSLFTHGHPAKAIQMLDALIKRLQQTTVFAAAFPLALAQAQLGRIYFHGGHAERAIPILRQTVGAWERLVGQAANLSPPETIEDILTGETHDAKRRREVSANQLNNLAATLGDLANALMSAGHLDEALSTAEQSLSIHRALGHASNVVIDLVQTAQILIEQGRYQEADARYEQALEADRRIGNQEVKGTILQHQGILADAMQQYDRAVILYTQALRRFQDSNDDGSIMRTCNLLGEVELQRGRLPEARAWYERSHEIAQRRRDTRALGIAVQNIGIVCQREGEATWRRGDEATARQWFAEAERFLQESLRMKLDRQDQPGEATSHGQLSQVYLLMGELDEAEAHAHQGREIDEGLGLIRQLPIHYNNLAQITRARGDEAQAAQWEAKRHEVEAELARRALGDAADAGL